MREKIGLAISGCGGRMGTIICDLVSQDPRFRIAVALEKSGHPLVGRIVERWGLMVSDNPEEIQDAQVLIEFSTPEATIIHLPLAVKYKMAMVIATTGLNEEEVTGVKRASATIPILFSPNMAFGANYVLKLVQQMAKELGPEWDIEGVEMHHNKKKDVPSGTAKKGIRLIKEGTGREIPFHALRIGSVPGKHWFFFARQGEVIMLFHEAESPVLFAKGTLDLTRRLIGRPPGLYDPGDLI